MGVVRSNHCAYDTHYHIVFPVKYRKALLREPQTKAILEIAKEISERYDIEFEKIGTDGDHIHILTSFHPKSRTTGQSPVVLDWFGGVGSANTIAQKYICASVSRKHPQHTTHTMSEVRFRS